jgi:hypothetical protein
VRDGVLLSVQVALTRDSYPIPPFGIVIFMAQNLTPPTPDLTMLTSSMPWKRLSLAQKVFCKAYILNDGNALDAVRRAYPTAKPNSLRSMGWEVRHSKNVVACLDWWAGRDDRARIIEIVQKQLDASSPGSIAASKFSAQLQALLLGSPVPGRRPGEPREESDCLQTFKIGDIIEQIGSDGHPHRFRLEAVPVEEVSK